MQKSLLKSLSHPQRRYKHRAAAVVDRYRFCRGAKISSRAYSSTTPALNLVPVVLENSVAGERSFDIYSRLLRERIICVHGQVTDQMASVVTAQLLFLEAEAPDKPVYMYINSPGGVVTAGLASVFFRCILFLLSKIFANTPSLFLKM